MIERVGQYHPSKGDGAQPGRLCQSVEPKSHSRKLPDLMGQPDQWVTGALQTEIGLCETIKALSDRNLDAVRNHLLSQVESSFAGSAEASIAIEIDREIIRRRASAA